MSFCQGVAEDVLGSRPQGRALKAGPLILGAPPPPPPPLVYGYEMVTFRVGTMALSPKPEARNPKP